MRTLTILAAMAVGTFAGASPAVAAPDFQLTVTPKTVFLPPSGSVHLTIGATGTEGFSSPLTLTAMGLPTGVTATFTPNPLNLPGTSDLTLTGGAGLIATEFNVNIAATGGGITHFALSAASVLDFELKPIVVEPPPCTGTFEGTITNSETGARIANTSFQIGPYRPVVTDADGHYGPIESYPGDYQFAAETFPLRGYWPSQRLPLTIVCNAATALNFALLPWHPATVFGRVLEGTPSPTDSTVIIPTTTPIQGVEVLLEAGAGPVTATPSAADGSYTTNVAHLGQDNTSLTNVRLFVNNAEGYWPRSSYYPSPIPIGVLAPFENKLVDVALVRQCTGKISGIVRYGDTGLLATGVDVISRHGYAYHDVVTDANGAYTIDEALLGYNNIPVDHGLSASVPIGHPRINYYNSATGTTHLDACGAERVVNLVLPAIPMGHIEGRVYDDSGVLVAGAPIGIDASGCRPCVHTQATSDANGYYRISDIPAPSDWPVKFFDHFNTPYWTSQSKLVLVQAGMTTTHDVHIVRKRFASVDGTVRDAITSAPLPGVDIRENGEDGPFTASAANGSYTLGPIGLIGPDNGARPTSVDYFADGYWPHDEELTVEKDQPPYTRNVALIPICRGAVVTGVVRHAVSGAPIAFALVTTDSSGPVLTNENGVYRLENLDVGSKNSPTELVITASMDGFENQTKSIEIFCGAKVAVGSPATIEIEKTTEPDGDPTEFSFSGELGRFALADGETHQVSGLFPGTYDITEAPVAGWRLRDVTCGAVTIELNGEEPLSIQVGPGETVRCRFNNEQLGTLVVKKETQPDGDTTPFLFFGPEDSFTLADGQRRTFADFAPGAYIVSEQPEGAWDVESSTCDDNDSGSDPELGLEIAVNLAPGETVTCTFTNVRVPTGTIVVKKETDPDGNPAVFGFFGADEEFSLADGESKTFADLRAGTYPIQEYLPDGWVVDRVVCDDDDSGSDPASDPPEAVVNLAGEETVTCTFHNRRLEPETGTIVVTKTTDPANDPTSFPFTSEELGTFDLVGGASQNFASLTPGLYALTEGIVEGWTLDSATCDDGSPIDAIDLEVDETVTCTFHNVRDAATGSIVINKATDPADDLTAFAFTGDLGAFELAGGQSKRVDDLPVGLYSVAETALEGWDVAASCDDGSLIGAIDVSADETVTCAFTNTKRATLIITKETDPAADPQDFGFTATGSGLTAFSLDTDAADGTHPTSRSFVLVPGVYAVTETLPVAGWDFGGVVCISASGTSSVPAPSTVSATVGLTLAAGDQVTCTYRNTERARLAVTKTVSGQPPSGVQSFDFEVRKDASPTSVGTTIGSGRADAGNGGIVAISITGNPATTLLVKPGTYQFCEFILPGWGNPLGNGSFVPGLALDSTMDNAFQCISVTVGAGVTQTYTLDNLPPPGGQGKTIGFWKNWASCAKSSGKQRPILDQTLATIPGGIPVGTLAVSTCPVAVDLLNKSAIADPTKVGDGTRMASDPAFNFAAQYVAFKLNIAAGARSNCTAANSASGAGQAILLAIAFDGRTHARISRPDSTRLNETAAILDKYNNNTLAC